MVQIVILSLCFLSIRAGKKCTKKVVECERWWTCSCALMRELDFNPELYMCIINSSRCTSRHRSFGQFLQCLLFSSSCKQSANGRIYSIQRISAKHSTRSSATTWDWCTLFRRRNHTILLPGCNWKHRIKEDCCCSSSQCSECSLVEAWSSGHWYNKQSQERLQSQYRCWCTSCSFL